MNIISSIVGAEPKKQPARIVWNRSSLPLLLLLAVPAAVNAQFTFNTNNGTITINGYTGPGGEVIIPATTNGLPVTTIGDGAFYNCTNVANVTIPGSVTSIDDWAFAQCSLTNVTLGTGIVAIGQAAFGGCSNLNSFAIPNSVTNIGEWAFWYCYSLRTVTIPDSVTGIGEGAFAESGLTSATIGNSTIPPEAFEDCASLADVTMGTNVTSIGSGAFIGTGLTSVMVPRSVTSIGLGAFDACQSLKALTVDPLNPVYSSVAGVLFDKLQTTLIQFPAGATGSYTLPASAITIAPYAFDNCLNLTSVTVPNSVRNIGDGAFRYCYSLAGAYFQGDPPGLGGSHVFDSATNATVYYLPGTTGWAPTFGGRPTEVWLLPYPLILTSGPGFGLKTNAFGFVVSWAANLAVVVETCTNAANPAWYGLQTNTLTDGWCYFSDSDWANYTSRFYRIRSL